MESSLINYSFIVGWRLFRDNLLLLIGSFFVIGIIMLVLTGIGGVMFGLDLDPEADPSGAGLIWRLVLFLVNGFLFLGLLRVYLDVVTGQPSSITRLFSQGDLLLKYLLAGFLYALFVAFGLFFFIFPGIFLMIKLFFYDFLIVDKRAGISESLQESWNITKGYWWSLLGLMILLFFINIAGMMALIIGLIFTIPFSLLVLTCAYHRLSSGLNPAVVAVDSGEELALNSDGDSAGETPTDATASNSVGDTPTDTATSNTAGDTPADSVISVEDSTEIPDQTEEERPL